ncbi:MAG: hypothetical protein ACKO7B_00390, partial [Flavobacteriales bacterium]
MNYSTVHSNPCLMNRIARLLLLISVFCTNSAFAALDKFVLANNGQSSHVIELPLQPTEQEKRAAEILKEYVYRISGASIRIVTEDTSIRRAAISIGRTIAAVQRYDSS